MEDELLDPLIGKSAQQSQALVNTVLCEWNDCNQSFETRLLFNNHIIHNHINSYDGETCVCLWKGCEQEFQSLPLLTNHLRSHSLNDNDMKSKSRVKSIDPKMSFKTRAETKSKTCQWNACRKTFESYHVLFRHVLEDHIEEPERQPKVCLWISCPSFGRRIEVNYDFIEHITKHLLEIEDQNVLIDFVTTDLWYESIKAKWSAYFKNDSLINESLICEWNECNTQFQMQSHLESHINSVHLQGFGYQPLVCLWKDCSDYSHYSKQYITKHIKRMHLIKKTDEIFTSRPPPRPIVDSESCRVAVQSTRAKWQKKDQLFNLMAPFAVISEKVTSISVQLEAIQKLRTQLQEINISRPQFKLMAIQTQNINQSVDKIERNAEMIIERYICEWNNCSKYFGTRLDLSKHIDDCHITEFKDNRYDCLWRGCISTYDSKHMLKSHYITHCLETKGVSTVHLKLKRLSIESDKKDLSSESAQEKVFDIQNNTKDKKNELIKTIKCQWNGCNYTEVFATELDLEKHIHFVHLNSYYGKPYVCLWKDCSNHSYLCKPFIVNHLKTHLFENPIESSHSSKAIIDSKTETSLESVHKSDSDFQSNHIQIIQQISDKSEEQKNTMKNCHSDDCDEDTIISLDDILEGTLNDSLLKDSSQSSEIESSSDATKQISDEPNQSHESQSTDVITNANQINSEVIDTIEVIKTHTTHKFACHWMDCNESFTEQIHLSIHLRDVHINRDENQNNVCLWFDCRFNQIEFVSKVDCVLHIISHGLKISQKRDNAFRETSLKSPLNRLSSFDCETNDMKSNANEFTDKSKDLDSYELLIDEQNNALFPVCDKEYDFHFKIGDKNISAHKTVLKCRSQIYEKSIWNSYKKYCDSDGVYIIPIIKYSYRTFFLFMRFVYTNLLEVTVEEAIDLLDLAEDYEEEELIKRCFKILKRGVCVANLCDIFSAAFGHRLTDLEQTCIEFAANNFNDIMNSDSFVRMDSKLCNFLITNVSKFKDKSQQNLQQTNPYFKVMDGLEAIEEAVLLVCKWNHCNEELSSESNLKRHMNDKHYREFQNKPYVCLWKECSLKGKSVDFECDLLSHIIDHIIDERQELGFNYQ